MSYEEEWKSLTIDGYAWPYDISNHGHVKRNRPAKRHPLTGKHIKPFLRSGYLQVGLHDNRRKAFSVHRLVAHAFLGPCPTGHIVHHKDRNRTNNRLENLEYLSDKIHRRGEYSGRTHLTEKQVLEIKETMGILKEKYDVSGRILGTIADGRAWGWLK